VKTLSRYLIRLHLLPFVFALSACTSILVLNQIAKVGNQYTYSGQYSGIAADTDRTDTLRIITPPGMEKFGFANMARRTLMSPRRSFTMISSSSDSTATPYRMTW